MAMVALPIPPLPMLACRELEEEHSFVSSDHTVASSHDMIAHLMNVACAVTSTEINSERQAKQTRIGDELFASVDEWQSQNPAAEVPPVDWCYEQATKFTRGYIASYLPHKKEEEVDARFLPAHDIDPSHRIHRMALEFQRAQVSSLFLLFVDLLCFCSLWIMDDWRV